MLHSYAFSNNQSFRDRVEVNLTVSNKACMTNWMAETETGERVSKLLAIVGPNGSGKTALIKPMAFLGWFISESFQSKIDAKIPVTPHFANQNEPSEFECVVDFDGKLWKYILKCTRDKVLFEALYLKKERYNYIFVREWSEDSQNYKVKQQDFGLQAKIAKSVRKNVSLISWAAQYGAALAVRMASNNVISNVYVLGRVPVNERTIEFATQHFVHHEHQKKLMNKLLSSWDLGLTGVDIVEVQDDHKESTKKSWLPIGNHRSGGRMYSLPFAFESSGTQGAFVLLYRLLHTLEFGGLAVIDEFENDLHPHMIEPILNLFASKDTNPYNAQLLFTCHAIEILNILEKCQIMLVEKNDDCESSAIRMDNIQGIRNDDNFYAKYNAGTYGAVPNI